MRMRSRIAALLALAALAFALWWFLRPEGAGGGIERAGDRATHTSEERPAIPGSTVPTLLPTPEGARPQKPKYTLTVRLVGVPEEQAKDVRLHVSARGNKATDAGGLLDAPSDPSGTTVLDVEKMAREVGYHTIQVMADGAWFLPSYAALALPFPLEARLEGLDLVLEVSPERAGMLTGRVLGSDGKPAVNAMVHPDVWGGFANEEERGYGTTAFTDTQGRFRVLSRPGRELVALAVVDGDARASRPVALAAGQTVDVGTIEILPAREWRARVEGTAGLGLVSVRAMRLGARRHSEIPGFAWTRDCLARTWVTPGVDENGISVVPFVSPGWWRLTAEAPDWGCAQVHDVLRASTRVANTRETSPTLDVARARMLFHTNLGGKPRGRTQALLLEKEALAFRTDDAGYGCLVVRPSTVYELVVYGADVKGQRLQVTSAPNGQTSEVTIDLQPGASEVPAEHGWATPGLRRTLALDVLASGNGFPATVHLRNADGQEVPATWVERYPLVDWRTDGRLLGLGTAELVTELKPGDYVLRVEAPGMVPQERRVRLPLAPGEFDQLHVDLETE